MRIAPYHPSPSCEGKWLGIGSVLADGAFNENPQSVGLVGSDNEIDDYPEYTRVTFFRPDGNVWRPAGSSITPCKGGH